MRTNIIRKRLFESVIDFARHTLPSSIWNMSKDKITIRDEVKERIINLLKEYFGETYDTIVDEINITGSIGTYQWSDGTDIDVHVIPKNIEKNKEKYQEMLGDLFRWAIDKNVKIDNHPIEIFLQLEPSQEERSDAVYDLLRGVWKVEPTKIEAGKVSYDKETLGDDLDEAFKSFDIKIGEINREIIDSDVIDKFLDGVDAEDYKDLQALLLEKLKNIEKELRDMEELRDFYRSKRNESYSTPEIAFAQLRLAKKSQLPGNVIFKMLQKYGYISLSKKLKNYIKDGIIDTDEIQDIKADITNILYK